MCTKVFLSLCCLYLLVQAGSPNSNHDKVDGSSEFAEALWQQMSGALLFLADKDRSAFLLKCGATTCSRSVLAGSNSPFHWAADIEDAGKERFWQVYECFKKRDVDVCPVDGGWALWSDWSKCLSSCNMHRNQTRTRKCDNPTPQNKGLDCAGTDSETRLCQRKCTGVENEGVQEADAFLRSIHHGLDSLKKACLEQHCSYDQVAFYLDEPSRGKYWSSLQCVKYNRACPVDGSWSSWSDWSKCSPACAAGIQYSSRSCDDPQPSNEGLSCVGSYIQTRPCFTVDDRQCKDVVTDGNYLTDWSEFSECSVLCGSYGIQEQHRNCFGVNHCLSQVQSVTELVIQKPCYNGPCPKQGHYSDWTKWTECSANCGRGRRTRMRLCNYPPAEGSGRCLGPAIGSRTCSITCPESDARATVWNSFVRNEKKQLSDELKVDKPGSGDPYSHPVDPSVEDQYMPWGQWSACTKSCEGGQRTRLRQCQQGSCLGEVRQLQFCNIDSCPVRGGWGNWLPWTPCSATCGNGVQKRYRRCDKPLPKHGGSCIGLGEETRDCQKTNCPDVSGLGVWGAWSQCSETCGVGGSRSRQRSGAREQNPISVVVMCDLPPCPVDGTWSAWTAWSSCSHRCGLGHQYHDRTCTDPAPQYGGRPCGGPGSEDKRCFAGPCQDSEDWSSSFTGMSRLLYAARHHPAQYLAMYVLLNPEQPSGVIIQRIDGCQETQCQHHVELVLEGAVPTVRARLLGSELTVAAGHEISMSDWHTIFVQLTGSTCFLRVDDGPHYTGKFNPPLSQDINLDWKMFVGADLKFTDVSRNFHGNISSLWINFQKINLIQLEGWQGYGNPIKAVGVTKILTDPRLRFPMFRGKHFTKLMTKTAQYNKTSILVVLWPEVSSSKSVVLFSGGTRPGTYFMLYIHNNILKFRWNCGEQEVRDDIGMIQPKFWYQVTVDIRGVEADIRVNTGHAIKLTGRGTHFTPLGTLLVGGGEKQDIQMFSLINGQTSGFVGFIDQIVMNDQSFSFRDMTLQDVEGFVNSMGYGRAGKVEEIVEHMDVEILLVCESGSGGQSVEWLYGDQVLGPTQTQVIRNTLPDQKDTSTLTLLPDGHHEGLYACAVKEEGRFTVSKVFSVVRHSRKLDFYDTVRRSEEVTSYAMLIAVLIVLFVLLLYPTIFTIQTIRKDGLDETMDMYKKQLEHTMKKTGVHLEQLRKLGAKIPIQHLQKLKDKFKARQNESGDLVLLSKKSNINDSLENHLELGLGNLAILANIPDLRGLEDDKDHIETYQVAGSCDENNEDDAFDEDTENEDDAGNDDSDADSQGETGNESQENSMEFEEQNNPTLIFDGTRILDQDLSAAANKNDSPFDQAASKHRVLEHIVPVEAFKLVKNKSYPMAATRNLQDRRMSLQDQFSPNNARLARDSKQDSLGLDKTEILQLTPIEQQAYEAEKWSEKPSRYSGSTDSMRLRDNLSEYNTSADNMRGQSKRRNSGKSDKPFRNNLSEYNTSEDSMRGQSKRKNSGKSDKPFRNNLSEYSTSEDSMRGQSKRRNSGKSDEPMRVNLSEYSTSADNMQRQSIGRNSGKSDKPLRDSLSEYNTSEDSMRGQSKRKNSGKSDKPLRDNLSEYSTSADNMQRQSIRRKSGKSDELLRDNLSEYNTSADNMRGQSKRRNSGKSDEPLRDNLSEYSTSADNMQRQSLRRKSGNLTNH
ncbi:hypothetical protein ScPMuIL_003570 [Solemya velum]